MPKGKPWTKEEVKELRQLVEQGLKLDIIAAKLHKTEDALRAKIRRLGLEEEDQKK